MSSSGRRCEKTGKVGIAKVIIKTRQHLAGVKPLKHALVLELMHFAEELSDAEKLNVPKKSAEPGKREMEMAKALIDNMSSEWNPTKYKDDYRDALLEVIEEKVESGGEEIEEKPKPKKPSSKVIDLVAVCCRRAWPGHRAEVERSGRSRRERRRRKKRPDRGIPFVRRFPAGPP